MNVHKDRIITLWESVNREGVKGVVKFLKDSDFFIAPCSTEFHFNRPGGLAEHSLNVYDLLSEKAERYDLNVIRDTLIICGLGHDLCKADFYVPGVRNVKEFGKWVEKKVYKIDDKLPLGHGEKSLFILQNYIFLTPEEGLAIRWHMAAWTPGMDDWGMKQAYDAASKMTPLVTLLSTADHEAARIVERDE